MFRKLPGSACAFIEYAPVETAWAPVEGENYLYIYCLWVQGAPKGQGIGKALMDSCLQDARAQGRSGVCMLGARKQKAWLSDQSFAKKFGFETVDTAGEYELLAVRFDEAAAPHFTRYFIPTSARLSSSGCESFANFARRSRSRRALSMSTRCKRQSLCRARSITGRSFMRAAL